jgi:uncharacterized protein YqgQ
MMLLKTFGVFNVLITSKDDLKFFIQLLSQLFFRF